jgi:hypothetical protein
MFVLPFPSTHAPCPADPDSRVAVPGGGTPLHDRIATPPTRSAPSPAATGKIRPSPRSLPPADRWPAPATRPSTSPAARRSRRPPSTSRNSTPGATNAAPRAVPGRASVPRPRSRHHPSSTAFEIKSNWGRSRACVAHPAPFADTFVRYLLVCSGKGLDAAVTSRRLFLYKAGQAPHSFGGPPGSVGSCGCLSR